LTNFIIQFLLFSSSVGTLWFLSRKNDQHIYGLYISLLSQPVWLYESITKEQWGILCVSFLYVIIAVRGILEQRRNKKDKDDMIGI